MFRNKALPPLPQPDAHRINRGTHQHMAISIPDCACTFCAVNQPEIEDGAEPIHLVPSFPSQHHTSHSLPSTRSLLQVLYPPSYLCTPSPFPDPPSYSPSDSPYTAREETREIRRTSTTTNNSSTSPSHTPVDPLAQHPSLTGVPSQGSPFYTAPQTEPNSPLMGYVVCEEAEPPPAYSRFDKRRPRFPTASDILGPYPPMSTIRQAAQ